MRKQTFHVKKLILINKWNSLGIQPTMGICVMGLKARVFKYQMERVWPFSTRQCHFVPTLMEVNWMALDKPAS